VIRANLLPRPKETLRFLGLHVDADYVRRCIVGSAVIVGVAVLGVAIEELRVHRLDAAIAADVRIVESQSASRADAKRLALDVARYQEFARREREMRGTGNAAALSVARIGNGVPAHVWLERLAHDEGGFELGGSATSVDAVSAAIAGFGRSSPSGAASLVSIDNRSGDGVHFTVRIVSVPSKTHGTAP